MSLPHIPAAERPPLGLRPRYCVGMDETAEERRREILAAMSRYSAANKRIPDLWLRELQELNPPA